MLNQIVCSSGLYVAAVYTQAIPIVKKLDYERHPCNGDQLDIQFIYISRGTKWKSRALAALADEPRPRISGKSLSKPLLKTSFSRSIQGCWIRFRLRRREIFVAVFPI